MDITKNICEICGNPSNGIYTSIFGASVLCLEHGNKHPTIAYRPHTEDDNESKNN